jgi:molecular chaperone HscA
VVNVDDDKAKVLLENILERVERDSNSGKLRLTGVLSDGEYQALVRAHELLGGAAGKAATTPVLETVIPVSLSIESLSFAAPQDPEVLLCLDFGTAMSKASATRSDDFGLLELAIGRRAGQTEPVFALASSLYITAGGRVLFGENAIRESTQGQSGGRKRLDSLKDILCKDVVSNLDEAILEGDLNPTKVPLTKGDVVTLFLAYLTDMAVTELAEVHGSSRYVKRRFTRPVLPPDRAPWAEEQLRRLLARAQVVADTLHGQWASGVPVDHAKQILNQVRTLDATPEYLVGDCLQEPIAAIASRVRNYECAKDVRRLIVIVDVGAGTIDYAMFVQVDKKGQQPRFWELQNSVKVLRQAGNQVDNYLRQFIMRQAGLSDTDPDFAKIDAVLSLRIRAYKEELFRSETVSYVLENDATGVVRLSEFLEQEAVIGLEKQIHAKFQEVLDGINQSWFDAMGGLGIPIVFTGGGSNLPFVRSLAKSVLVRGRPYPVRGATPTPQWVGEKFPELVSEYPQLAVAIGGASREIPGIAPNTWDAFRGDLGPDFVMLPATKGN